MRKGIEHIADRALHNLCLEKSQEVALMGIEGSASTQLEIRRIADRVLEYALDPGTSFGIIEVAFPDKPYNGLDELYAMCPVGVIFKNFIPEEDVDQDTLLVKHLLVVQNWSNAIKVFKATIENERQHLMLYTAVKKPRI